MDYLSLCLICKDENDYLFEWLDYHILMGVDFFYIYDNGSQISLRETLIVYIERGWVTVVDIQGEAMQLFAYDHCLQTFGAKTFWLGFIDTDEFLIPKTTLDLKELLKDYETYGGLAVSSLFFGSNGHQEHPEEGQIASYTRRTHETFKENELVKSIVQPSRVLMPSSPHDFAYKENNWCVNESFLRVDNQRFPNRTAKIQLNHYYCRSYAEIILKLNRGNSGAVAWQHKRFDDVNLRATYDDHCITQNLDVIFQKAGIDFRESIYLSSKVGQLEKMAALASARYSVPLLEVTYLCDARSFRSEITDWMALKGPMELAKTQGNLNQVCQLLLQMIQIQPNNVHLYVDLAINYANITNMGAAWQALSHAWQLSPNNNIAVLSGMAFYFLKIDNFQMAENTCRLLLDLAPHNITVMGLLTHSLIGQGRFGDALHVGIPVVELSALVGELPAGMGIFLVKRMADYLLEIKDYPGAVHLWQAGVKCQPRNLDALLELSRALLLSGDQPGARDVLILARSLAPQNETVLTLFKQLDSVSHPHSSILRPKKKK